MENTPKKKLSVHEVLARSYSTYFVGIMVGVLASSYFQFKIMPEQIGEPLGILFLVLGGLLALWSQMVSRKSRRGLDVEGFKCGPYKFSRQPTNIGILAMALGFSFLMNSLAVLVFVLAAFLTSRKYIKKQEAMLEEKYGNLYVCYKQEVKRWF